RLHPRDELVLPALAPQHRAPQAVRIFREDVVCAPTLDEPVVALELPLELLPAPARDAREHAHAAERRRTRPERVVERDVADRVDDPNAGVVRIVELREHGDAGGIHGAADEDRRAAGRERLELW